MFNSLFVILGTIIGAGFASGREIFTFFNVYGFYGLICLILSVFIIGLIIFKVLSIIVKCNISTYEEFIHLLAPSSTFINSVFCNIINIFLFISFVIMFAGFSAFFSQRFNFPNIIGAILIGLLSFITLIKNITGLIKINLFFIPVLIIIVILLGLKNMAYTIPLHFSSTPFSISCILNIFIYSSYNLIVLIPILINLKKYIFTIKNAKIISFLVVICLLIMAIIIFVLLQYYYNDVANLELPLLFVAFNSGLIYKFIYEIAILIAIFTTAISSGYSFIANLNIKNKKIYMLLDVTICFTAICLSNVGFSNLLDLLYPILGYIGLLQVALIFFTK